MNVKLDGTKVFCDQAKNNRADFFATEIPAQKRIVEPLLYHTDRLLILAEDNFVASPEADAVVTQLEDVCLTLTGADCPGILAYDPIANVMGVAHSGWRGTILNILSRLVDAFCICGSDPANIFLGITPAIHSCCYLVGADVAEQFCEKYRTHIEFDKGKFRLDLVGTIKDQARGCGIASSKIVASPVCTCCMHDYFSYRREKVVPPKVTVSYLYLQ
jgi:YfiH family protein